RLIAVDEAGFRPEVRETGLRRRLASEFAKDRRHVGPGSFRIRIDRVVAITGTIGDPAKTPAISHGDRHGVTARRYQVAKRRLLDDAANRVKQVVLDRLRETAQ